MAGFPTRRPPTLLERALPSLGAGVNPNVNAPPGLAPGPQLEERPTFEQSVEAELAEAEVRGAELADRRDDFAIDTFKLLGDAAFVSIAAGTGGFGTMAMGLAMLRRTAVKKAAELGAARVVSGGARTAAVKAAETAAEKAAGGLRNRAAELAGTQTVGGAALRAGLRTPGAVPAAAGSEFLFQKVFPIDPELSAEEAAVFAGGAEAVMQALTPAGGPIGRFVMWALGRKAVASGTKLGRIPLITRGLRGQQPGADEAMALLEGSAETLTAGQVAKSQLWQSADAAAEAGFLSAGPMQATREEAERNLSGQLRAFADNLAAQGPAAATEALQAVLEGAGILHRSLTRNAYKQLDRALAAWARAQGGIPLQVDMRPLKSAAARIGAKGPVRKLEPEAIRKLKGVIAEYDDFASFELADELRSMLLKIGRLSGEMFPDLPSGVARELADSLTKSIDDLGRQIAPGSKVPGGAVTGDFLERGAAATGPGRQTAAQQTAATVAGQIEILDIFNTARALHRTGKEVFNESMIGNLLKTQTEDQFARMVTSGLNAPETMRQVRNVLHDERYLEAVQEVGRRSGIANMRPEQLWDSVRGKWLQDLLAESPVDEFGNLVRGKTVIGKITKQSTRRDIFKELYSVEQQGNIRDLMVALARSQATVGGGAAKQVVRLLQLGAVGTSVTAIVVPESREFVGGTAGFAVPAAILLGPRGLAAIVRNKGLVNLLRKGLSIEQRRAQMTRYFTQLTRALTQANISFEVKMSDGSVIERPERATATTGGPFQ